MTTTAGTPVLVRTALAAALASCCLTPIAHAQLIQQYFPNDIPGYEPDFSASVLNRMYQQEQTQGVEVGDFVIRPMLNENFGYNSNTLGGPDSGSSEIESKAGVRINSDWERDALGMSVNVDDLRYPEVSEASYTNWSASVGGSLNLGDDVASLAYSHFGLNLAATSLGAAGVVVPVPYSVDDARLSYLKLFGRFSITPSFEFENFSFGNAGTGDFGNFETLSHKTEIGTITGRLERSPGNAIVFIFRSSAAQFDQAPVNNYLDFAGFAGLDMRGNRVIQYRALVGVESRSFQNSVLSTAVVPTFELDALWTPTELDTVTLTGLHQLDDPSSPFVQDQNIFEGRVEWDHELQRNVFLTAYTGLARSNARSATAGVSNLIQTQVSFGGSAVWNISQHLSGTISYGFNNTATRGGNGAAPNTINLQNFTSNIILVGFSIFE